MRVADEGANRPVADDEGEVRPGALSTQTRMHGGGPEAQRVRDAGRGHLRIVAGRQVERGTRQWDPRLSFVARAGRRGGAHGGGQPASRRHRASPLGEAGPGDGEAHAARVDGGDDGGGTP